MLGKRSVMGKRSVNGGADRCELPALWFPPMYFLQYGPGLRCRPNCVAACSCLLLLALVALKPLKHSGEQVLPIEFDDGHHQVCVNVL
jgi:hypothetical protein